MPHIKVVFLWPYARVLCWRYLVCICTNGMHMHMHVHMQDSRPGGVHTAIEKRLLCGA